MVTGIVHDERAEGRGTRRGVLGLVGMCVGTALIVMEASVVNVAVPTIRSDFNAGPSTAPWAVDAYTLVPSPPSARSHRCSP